MIQTLNYFCKEECRYMESFRKARIRLLAPLAEKIVRTSVSANMVSVVGLLMAFGFAAAAGSHPVTALAFLAVHVLLDGLDGPIAAAAGSDGHRGALVDILCDHTGMIVVVAGLVYQGLADGVWGIVYVYLYTVMIAFTVARNALGMKPRIVVRSKYVVYVLFAVYAGLDWNAFDVALSLFSVVMLVSVLNDFLVIGQWLRGGIVLTGSCTRDDRRAGSDLRRKPAIDSKINAAAASRVAGTMIRFLS